MQKYVIASLVAAAFVVATCAPTLTEAATKKHVVKHQVVVADRDQPQDRYGLPANYYPAPPFPFFLLPGPWWLPAHP